MKKVITLCLFAFAMLIGTQSTFGQNKLKINEKAANSAKELRAQLKFDEEALEKIYIAYQEYETKMASLDKYEVKVDEYDKAMNQMTMRLQHGIKNAISPELYARYLSITGQDEIEAQEMEAQTQNKTPQVSKKGR